MEARNLGLSLVRKRRCGVLLSLLYIVVCFSARSFASEEVYLLVMLEEQIDNENYIEPMMVGE